MRNLAKMTLCLVLLGSLSMTGCYPGDVQDSAESGSLSEAASTENVEDILKTEDENLSINIPAEDISTETLTAYNGMRAYGRPWDLETVLDAFGSDIAETKVAPNDSSGSKNYAVYMLKDGSKLSMSDGELYYTSSSVDEYHLKDDTEMRCPSITAEMYDCSEEDEIEDFPRSEALSTLQTYIDKLDIPICGDPFIYVLDDAHLDRLREKEYPDPETRKAVLSDYPESVTPAYRIVYAMETTEGMRLSSGFFAYTTGGKFAAQPCLLRAIVTKEGGVVSLDCRHVVTVDQTDAEEITACSGATALKEVKRNLENGLVDDNTVLENMYFGYVLRHRQNELSSYDMVPVWTFGKAFTAGTEFYYSDTCFVNAETGKEENG